MSISRWMDKKAVVHIHNGVLAIKKNTFESVLMRWMKLEPIIIHSEVSQKEKHQYSIRSDQSLSHVWLFATPWITAHQASLSITNSRSSLNSCPSSQWCHPAISSSVIPFFSCPQSLPASESFPMSQFFTWGGESTGVSKVRKLPNETQGPKF